MWGRAQLIALLTVAVVATPRVGGRTDGDAASTSSEEEDAGLKVGRSVDLFTRFGYLSLSVKVVPRNDSSWVFREPTIDIFDALEPYQVFPTRTSRKQVFDGEFHMEFCDNLKQLLQAYFRHFEFERIDRPWTAFTASWAPETIARNLGINSSFVRGGHCYVLVRLSRFRHNAALSRIPNNVNLVDVVAKEIDNIEIGDVYSVIMFIKKYGSHYIQSFVTGNSMYQVFVYRKPTFQRIKERLSSRPVSDVDNGDLKNFFSPWYSEHIGLIKVASGNNTVERWAAHNLRVNYYIFSYITLLKIHGNTELLSVLNNLLEDEAVLEMSLRTLAPAFKDPIKRQWFEEVLDNYSKLWESNL